MGTKKKDAGYHAAVTGARGILKTLIYICLLLLLVFAGKTAYDFGYDIFVQQPVASEENGQDITVEVTENMGVREIGEMLIENGVIDESLSVFQAQVVFSGFKDSLQPGTYILNTSQTVDEMIQILARENTEGQPTAEDTAEQQ